ncbi:hypothetical protein HY798_01120 [Candidatus Falkowbacteria bacterium]|nr:hypothetical protein [Candidatus Falkowbacteria bacterium]
MENHKAIVVTLLIFGAALAASVALAANDGPGPEPSVPGTVGGTGSHFEITDSEYLNVSLQSTEEITVLLESAPKIISLHLKASTSTNSAILAIKGLELNKTYHQFQDSYKNEAIFV